MAISIVMPALELAQESGTLVSWQKKEGERVAKGEPLLEVETDKATVEIESPGDGILAALKAREGDVIAVGTIIGWILKPGEVAPPEAGPAFSQKEAARPPLHQAPTLARPPEPSSRGPRISPKARQLAAEHDVDIRQLQGSGPGGEILSSDILAAARPHSSSSGKLEAPSAVGRLMAERTTQSWTSVPHFFLSADVDAAGLVLARERMASAIEQTRGMRPSFTDLLVALVARVLQKHTRMYATWTGEGIRSNPEINIGVAIAVKDGVVSAVIHGAADLGVAEIAVRQKELSQHARTGKLRPADIAGATFTISNLGMYNVDAFSAIIPPQQAAILAVGRISDRVVPVDKVPQVRPMITLTLSCDHRVVDGARAGEFLNDLSQAIQNPDRYLSQ